MVENNYKILIPYDPESVNKVITYGKKEGDIVVLKHKWQKIAHIYIEQAIASGDLPTRFKGRIGVFFKLYFKTIRGRDGDNYAAMCKGIIDALVQKNLLLDDTARYVDDDGRRLRIDADQPRCEVYITEYIPDDKLVKIKPYDRQKLGSN